MDIETEKMSDEKKDDRGFDSYIPVWDGRSETLREFKKSVQWWLHSIDLEKTTSYNLAARFAMRQKGSANYVRWSSTQRNLNTLQLRR